jgi:LETM1 and EF-hand domain-containing protein 1, mitochondrial
MSLWLPRSPSMLQSSCRRHLSINTRSVILQSSWRHRDIALTSSCNNRSVSTNSQKTPSQAPPNLPPGHESKPASTLATTSDRPPLIPRVWKAVKDGASHYWHGSKLLVSEVRISARLQWKLLHGEALTRREKRQVCSFLSESPVHR